MRFWKVAAVSTISALALAAGGTTAFAGTTPVPTGSESVSPNFGVNPTPRPVLRSCEPVRIRTFTPTVSPTDEVSPTDDGSLKVRAHPTPTVTETVGVQPRSICRPEHFNIALVLAGPNLSTELLNYAAATGPVNGSGSDDQVSNTLDRFNLPGGRVNVRHTGIPFPLVNLRNCTVAVVQNGNWTFNGGQGINRFAIGNGTFHLALLAHFPNIRNVCSLRFLLRVNPLLQNRIGPDFLTVAVHGDGVAAR